MELFKPSDKILKMICSENEIPLIQYEVFPFSSYEDMQKNQGLYLEGIRGKILRFYEMFSEENKERVDLHKTLYLCNEAFKNWVNHSPENSSLESGLFLGSMGVCYGFHDGGDFFKKTEIKNQLENKINFKEFDKNPRGKTSRHGFSNIYKFSDFIEVDSEKGILYCVQLEKNILAPEGKNGSEYFYELRKNN
jgi:hypothetical protein